VVKGHTGDPKVFTLMSSLEVEAQFLNRDCSLFGVEPSSDLNAVAGEPDKCLENAALATLLKPLNEGVLDPDLDSFPLASVGMRFEEETFC
jgi:hypothetical protein